MGTSNSADELAVKLVSAGNQIVRGSKDCVQEAAQAYKSSVLEQARKDTGGDGRMSRWGRKSSGTTLSAGYKVGGSQSSPEALLTPRPAGPWRVLEDGARPHLIVPGLTRRQARALTLFSVMAGQGGDLGGYDIGAIAASARGTRNNRGGSRRRKRRPPLLINGSLRAYAKHPGTKGKDTWSKGIRNGEPQAMTAVRRTQAEALLKVFGR
jgi:hypothetical protein